MSWSRFGCDGSEVYTFPSSAGYECCGCVLNESHSIAFKRVWRFVAHILNHRLHGHTVPGNVECDAIRWAREEAAGWD